MHVLRDVTLQDVGQIADIDRECFVVGESWEAEDFIDYVDDSVFLAIEDEHQLVAYILVDETELISIATRKAHRVNGYANQLWEAALERIGKRSIMLHVRVSNRIAAEWYSRLGFVREGTETDYYDGPLEDAYVMRLLTS